MTADYELSTQQQALAHLLELSSVMLAEALNDNWDLVCELQVVRDGFIQDFFSKGIVVDKENVAEVVKSLLDSDAQLVLLGQDERAKMKEQMAKIKSGKGAVKAYST